MPDLDIGKLVGYIELDDTGVSEGVKGVRDKISDLGVSGANLAKAAGVGLGLAVAGGLLGAMTAEPAQAKLTAQLGLTASESERIGGVAGSLYSHAYGDSLGDVNEAIRSVIQNVDGMGTATSDQLEAISGKVIAVANTFDQDLGGVTKAVGQLMRTGLADNADQALDIITRGFQTGTNAADDLLDTFSEYGTQARKLGLDGAEFTGLLSQGLQAGARDADVVADALKELSIRAVDGSETTAAGFAALGLSGEDMGRKFAAGGASAEAALDTTLDRLRGIPDPVARSAAAVQLFGTQAEDLGAALYSLDPSAATDALGDFAGAADRVNETVGDTAQAKFEAFTRTLQTFATDTLGGAVLPILTSVGTVALDVVGPPLEALGTIVQGVAGFFNELPGPIQTTVIVLGGLAAFRGPLGDAFDAVKGAATDALETVRLRSMYASEAIGANGGGLAGAFGAASGAAGGAARGGIAALTGAMGGPLGLAIAGVTIGLPILTGLLGGNSDSAGEAARANSNLTAALKESNGVINDSVRLAAAKDAADKGLLDNAEAIGVNLADVTEALVGNEDALARVTDAANAYIDASLTSENAGDLGMTENADAAQALLDGLDELAPTVSENADTQRQLAEATGDSTTVTGEQAQASADAADAAQDQADAVDTLKTAIDNYTGANIGLADAQINTLNGLADLDQLVTDAAGNIDKSTASLDVNTQAGRDAQSAILDQIQAVGDLSVATFRQTGSSDAARDAYYREIEALRGRLTELGYNEEEVNNLIAQYAAIPESAFTSVSTNAGTVLATITTLKDKLETIDRGTYYVDVYTNSDGGRTLGRGYSATGNLYSFYASGGIETDPASGRPMYPMAANLAARVPAGTLRVIGDRPNGDEFYLPDDDAPRTMAFGIEWARRRGLDLVPVARYAAGGMYAAGASSSPSAGAAINLTVRIDGNVYGDQHLRDVVADAGDQLLDSLGTALTNAGVHT